jgi:hypothetical protein
MSHAVVLGKGVHAVVVGDLNLTQGIVVMSRFLCFVDGIL